MGAMSPLGCRFGERRIFHRAQRLVPLIPALLIGTDLRCKLQQLASRHLNTQSCLLHHTWPKLSIHQSQFRRNSWLSLRASGGSGIADVIKQCSPGAENPNLPSADTSEPVVSPTSEGMPEASETQSDGASPSPEEVVQKLRALAGFPNEVPPPEVLGVALHKQGVPPTRINVERALRAAAEPIGQPVLEEDVLKALSVAKTRVAPELNTAPQMPSGGPSDGPMSPEAVVLALCQAAGPGAGMPPAEVIGMALEKAGVPVTDANVV